MIEAAIIGLVTAAGFVVLVPFKRLHAGYGLVWFAPIVGTAVYVLAALALVSVGLFSTVRTLGVLSIVTIAAAFLWWRRERPESITVRPLLWQLGIALGIVVVAALLFQQIPLTRVSFDSYWYLMSANALESHGAMTAVPIPFHQVLKRQLVIPAIQAGGALTGRGYTIAWIPMLALSGLASTGWLGWQGGAIFGTAKRWRLLIGAAVTAFIATANQFLFHSFYIHSHMVFAAFLLVGVGLAWYAVATKEWGLLIPSSIAFAALVPLRAESVIVIVIFMLPILAVVERPAWTRWVLTVPIAGTTIVWYGWAIQMAIPDLAMKTRMTVFGNLLLAVGLVIAAVVMERKRFHLIAPYIAWLPLLGLLGILVFQAMTGFEDLWTTVTVMSTNVTTKGLWDAMWLVVPLLVFGGYIAVSFPFQRLFLIPLMTFVVALPVFSYLRGSPYRIGFGDSGNRMLMHVILVVALYLMLVANRAASELLSKAESVSR